MGHHEKYWLDNYSSFQVLFFRRYVDDTFCLFNNEEDALMFFDYINARHPIIRFIMEEEIVSRPIVRQQSSIHRY